MLLRPLSYVFYRILAWKLRDPRESTPILIACLSTILLLFLNLLVVTMLVNGFRGHQLLPPFPGGRVGLSTALLLSFAVGYSAMRAGWVENGRYSQLDKEFQSSDARVERRRTALFWTYITLSIALPFILSIFWPR